MNSSSAPTGSDEPVTIVTQTRVRHQAAEAFARWQEGTSKVIAGFAGFLEQTVMPPSPPQQVDWVILQRFSSTATAVVLSMIARGRCSTTCLGVCGGTDRLHDRNEERIKGEMEKATRQRSAIFRFPVSPFRLLMTRRFAPVFFWPYAFRQ